MKKLLVILTCLFATELAVDAHGGFGGGGFHGGGYHGGGSRSMSSRSNASRTRASSSRNGSKSSRNSSTRSRNNRNGNTYNHHTTNNFYGGRGYGYGGWGWGAAGWGMFGFTMVATTSALLVASSNGRQNTSDIQNALISSQVEIDQLQKRLDELESKQNETSNATQATGEKSPLENADAIKAYMEELKANQIKLQSVQNNSSQDASNEHKNIEENALVSTKNEKSDSSTIESLQNKIQDLKAQLYDYWNGNKNTAAA